MGVASDAETLPTTLSFDLTRNLRFGRVGFEKNISPQTFSKAAEGEVR